MDAIDSIRLQENIVQRIHCRNLSGHLHKGHGITAAATSIPSKYQTIVTNNRDRKGFTSQSKRFNAELDFTETPGPDSYLGHVKMDNNSVSFSKKGTGGLASKTKRQIHFVMSSAPGPGTYALPSLLITNKDFNKSETTSNFHEPIAVSIYNYQKYMKPAPNAYCVEKCKFGKANNVSAESAFKSKSIREFINVKEEAKKPAPGQYDVNDALLHDSAKIPCSSFQSKSKRFLGLDPCKFPGPGFYHPNEPVEPSRKMLFPRKHYLCLSAPAISVPEPPPSPGPGSYDVVDYDGPPTQYMSSAAFVSTTSRERNNVINVNFPGPGHYNPVTMGRQSFIFNGAGKWI